MISKSNVIAYLLRRGLTTKLGVVVLMIKCFTKKILFQKLLALKNCNRNSILGKAILFKRTCIEQVIGFLVIATFKESIATFFINGSLYFL